MSDFLRHIRETVTILRPMPSVVPRGKLSDKVRQPSRSLRMHEEELTAITKAADLLGMSRSAFMVWCSHHVANDVIKQYDEYVRRNG